MHNKNIIYFLKSILGPLKGTLLHPQWLSNRFHKKSHRHLRELNGCSVLDIGSGDSNIEKSIGEECSLFRLDYPATNLRYHKFPDIYGNASLLPIADNSFDAVLLLEVLEHVPDDWLVLEEINRVLKKNGRLYISIPFIYPLHDIPNDFRRYTIYGLRYILNRNGFVITREVHHGNSIIVAAQLLNIFLIEVVRDLSSHSTVIALLVSIIVYPVCVTINILSFPLLCINQLRASCFGYFVTAEKQ